MMQKLSLDFWKINREWDSKDKDARFKSLFGDPSVVIAAAWEMIKGFVRDDVECYHTLWVLIFLMVYAPNKDRGSL